MFLKIGITFTNFKADGKMPVSKDKLIMLVRMLAMSTNTRFKILVGILKGPVALLEEREMMVLAISSSETGLKKKEFVKGSLRYCL